MALSALSSLVTSALEIGESHDSDSDSSEDELDIHAVVRYGSLPEVKEAIARDRPRYIALKDADGRTVLFHAVELNRERIALFLIAKNADVNAKDNKEQTPLHLAASRGLSDMCRFLLDFNANLRLKDSQCWTALHHAVNGNHLDTATLLIKRGVDIHAEDHKFGRTALHLAAEKGFHEMAEMLIIRGADLCATGDAFFSKTPLHLACLHGHLECVEVLVRKGADVNALSGLLDKSPLHFAVEEGHVNCVKHLLSSGADVNLMGNHANGYSALHIAAARDQWHIMELLLATASSTHLNINLPGKFSIAGSTALHLACEMGHTHLVHMLLDMVEIDKEALDTHNQTPLHLACKHGHYGLAELLIEMQDCNFHAKALNGQTPVDMVSDSVAKDHLKLLCYRMDLRKQHDELLKKQRQAAEEAYQRKQQEEAAAQAALAAELARQRAERRHAFRCELTKICEVSGEIVTFQKLAAEYYIDQNINDPLVILPPNLSRTSNPDRPDPPISQSNALTRAAYRGFYDIVAALLHWQGINIDYQETETGNTALHYAAEHGFRDIVEILLLRGAKNYLMNKDGRVPANLVPAQNNALREIIRNVKLIARRHLFQDMVLLEIYRRQQMVGNNEEKDDDNESLPSLVHQVADLTVGQALIEHQLAQPETLKHMIHLTSPSRHISTVTTKDIEDDLSPSKRRIPQPDSSALQSPSAGESSSLKLPPIATFAVKKPFTSSLTKSRKTIGDVLGVQGHGPAAASGALSAQTGPLITPSMGANQGAHFTPLFATHLKTTQSHTTAATAAQDDAHSLASDLSVSLNALFEEAAMKSHGNRDELRRQLDRSQQRLHIPYQHMVLKNRHGLVENVVAASSETDEGITLPPIAGPMAMHTLDPGFVSEMDERSVFSLESFAEPMIMTGQTGGDGQSSVHEPLDATELSLSSLLPGTNTALLAKALDTKYGRIPETFGGTRTDLFFIALKQRQYHIDLLHHLPLTSIYHMQYSYLPTTFDTTEEYLDVKDFLWLLAYPYVNEVKELVRTTTSEAKTAGSELNNEERGEVQPFTSPMALRFLSVIWQASEQTKKMVIVIPFASWDKRCFLHDLAVCMNLIQILFTSPTATPSKSSLYQEQIVTPEQILERVLQSTSVHDKTRSRPALPKNLDRQEVSHLQQFAFTCRRFLVVFLTIYDANFPVYFESVLSICASSSATSSFYSTTAAAAAAEKKGDATETGPLSLEEEKAVVQALFEEIEYLAQYGYLDEAQVIILRDQLLPCCTIYSLSFLLPAHLLAHSQHLSQSSQLSTTAAKESKRPFANSIDPALERRQKKQQDKAADDEEQESYVDPLKDVWSPLLLNPPRTRRLAVDCLYELGKFLMEQAESSYAADTIRAHVWMTQGRQILAQYTREQGSSPAKTLLHQTHADHKSTIPDLQATGTSSGAQMHLPVPGSASAAGGGVQTGVSSAETENALAFRLWLEDLSLADYETYFLNVGFRLVDDFLELNEQDCYRYFPFLKIGDLRRLGRRCEGLSDGTAEEYRRRARKIMKKKVKKIAGAKEDVDGTRE